MNAGDFSRLAPLVQTERAMHTLHTIVVVSLVSAGILTLGCEHPQDRNVATSAPAPAPEPASATYAPRGATNAQSRSNSVDASVVERLTRARCDREQFCENVGGGKKYASREVCMGSFRSSIGNDLNSYQCPSGLDGSAVQQCLSAISGEECGAHPVEAITRMERCRKGEICMK